MSNSTQVTSPEHLQALLSADLSRVSLLYFRADWAEPCTQMDAVTTELAKRWPAVLFLSVRRSSRPPSAREMESFATPAESESESESELSPHFPLALRRLKPKRCRTSQSRSKSTPCRTLSSSA